MQSNNPYAPPRDDVDSLMLRRRVIRVGRDERHTVIVETSLTRGLRTHAVDAMGHETAVQRGPCRFQLGQREQHQVEVELDALQRVNVLVDGELVAGDLFPRMRNQITAIVFGFALVAAITVFLAVFVLYRLLAA